MTVQRTSDGAILVEDGVGSYTKLTPRPHYDGTSGVNVAEGCDELGGGCAGEVYFSAKELPAIIAVLDLIDTNGLDEEA